MEHISGFLQLSKKFVNHLTFLFRLDIFKSLYVVAYLLYERTEPLLKHLTLIDIAIFKQRTILKYVKT